MNIGSIAVDKWLLSELITPFVRYAMFNYPLGLGVESAKRPAGFSQIFFSVLE